MLLLIGSCRSPLSINVNLQWNIANQPLLVPSVNYATILQLARAIPGGTCLTEDQSVIIRPSDSAKNRYGLGNLGFRLGMHCECIIGMWARVQWLNTAF